MVVKCGSSVTVILNAWTSFFSETVVAAMARSQPPASYDELRAIAQRSLARKTSAGGVADMKPMLYPLGAGDPSLLAGPPFE